MLPIHSPDRNYSGGGSTRDRCEVLGVLEAGDVVNNFASYSSLFKCGIIR